jgi:hypothetical protein
VAGCYQLRLAAESWVDVTVARDAMERAEAAMRANDPNTAFGWTGVVTAIARREVLPREERPWLELQRRTMRQLLLQGLESFAAQILTST